MKYLYPQFLYALATIAIPIIIHLFNFRKFKTVYFSNVRFLKEIKQQTKAQSQLKHLLILLSRILAISALVFAFAQPYIPASENSIVADQQAVSVFVDNSFSMDAENEDGSLLNKARQQALAVANAYQNTDEFQILTNDLAGKHQRLLNKEHFIKELDAIESTANSNALHQVLNRQAHTLGSSTASRKDVYLISDFQEGMAQLEEWAVDSTINVRLLPVQPHPISNLYIDSCWLNTPNPQAGQNTMLSVRLINKGSETRKDVPITLRINGQQKALANTDVLDEEIVELNFSAEQTGWKNAVVSIQDHPITFDDDFYLCFEVKKQLLVQTIYENTPSKALDKLFGSDTYFNYSEQKVSQLNHSEILQQQLVVLDGLTQISSGLAQSLTTFVKEGGSLAIFPTENSNLESYQTVLQSLQTDYYLGLNKDGINITQLHNKHDLFKGVFESINQKLDFPKVEQYFTQSQFSQTNATPILSFENGQALINEYTFQNGKIYLANIGLSNNFGNFSQHALFVPILYNMASQSGGQQLIYHTVGDEQVKVSIEANKEAAFTLSNGESEFIPQMQNKQLWVYDQVQKAGHYQLKQKGTEIAWLAFNYDRKESNPNTLLLEELEAFASQHNNIQVINTSEQSLTQTLSTLNQGTALWKLCLIFALGFLALEILIIRLL
jgi:hypothetical protein